MPLPSLTAKTCAKTSLSRSTSGGCGAEVGREGDEVEEQRFGVGNLKANGLDARKELGVGVAEEVDGLHGVADHEAGAARALGPGGDEAGEQLVLAAAGVLKLVDEQVADAVGDGERGVGGQAVFAAEHALGDLRDLGEVDRAGFGKDHLSSAAAWRSSVKQARTICQSSSV